VLLITTAIMSVSLKVASGMVAAPAASSDLRHQLKRQLGVFLEREGFRVDENQQDNDFHLPVVKAVRDECRLLVAMVSPGAGQHALLTQLAAPDDQVSFIFQGKIYKEQPIWRPLIHQHLVRRLQGYAGIGSPSSSVVGAVASQDCNLGDVAWGNLGVESSD
jgi:hypothetical protein